MGNLRDGLCCRRQKAIKRAAKLSLGSPDLFSRFTQAWMIRLYVLLRRRRRCRISTGNRAIGWTAEESSFDYRKVQEVFSCPQRPYQLWDPRSLLSIGYGGFFLQEVKRLGVKLTIFIHLLLRLRMVELYLYSPIGHNGLIINLAQG
jgi:hypothetical protein